MKINVNLKALGKRKASVQPAVCEIDGCPATVRELILAVVQTGVEEYNQRMEHSQLLSCLTREEIQEKAQAGKVGFGVNYGEKKRCFLRHRKMPSNALRTAFTVFFRTESLWRNWRTLFV